jgi:hypothetical protein
MAPNNFGDQQRINRWLTLRPMNDGNINCLVCLSGIQWRKFRAQQRASLGRYQSYNISASLCENRTFCDMKILISTKIRKRLTCRRLATTICTPYLYIAPDALDNRILESVSSLNDTTNAPGAQFEVNAPNTFGTCDNSIVNPADD